MSQLLTLQCAIAHTDMPLESGPTRFMPYTQQFQKGYIAFRFADYFDWVGPRMSQLPLSKGDAVFFNPAVFHQPGNNTLQTLRTVGLFQVSSMMGRTMETVDRTKMSKAVWPVLKRWANEIGYSYIDQKGDQGLLNVNNAEANGHTNGEANLDHPLKDRQRRLLELEALIGATCEGYNFPRNHDLDRFETDVSSM
jgi:ectoine hydroxylase-related dioxygenase (phytanoyl-CoA dioxygenase family)